jgi:hypothetical protein
MQKDASEKVQRVLSEDVLTLRQAALEIQAATGLKPDKSSLTRWILRGIGGSKLEAVRIGRQWVTSSQAINRFISDRSI